MTQKAIPKPLPQAATTHSFEEIAQQTGLSRERVCRLEQKALETLRTSAQARAAQTLLETEA
ncbi:sigma factor-like helix-turn-helix DNA-binding protein [Cupriavidus necator]